MSRVVVHHSLLLMDYDVIKEDIVICSDGNTHVLQDISSPQVMGTLATTN